MGTFTHRSLRAWLFCFAVFFFISCSSSNDPDNEQKVSGIPQALNVHIDFDSNPVVEGSVLTGDYTFFHINGDTEAGSEYRWIKNGLPVGNGRTYTISLADDNQVVRFEVTPQSRSGTMGTTVITSMRILLGNHAPLASAAAIQQNDADALYIGDELQGDYTFSDDIDHDWEGRSSLRWVRGQTLVGTGRFYTITAEDAGQTLTFEVIPASTFGTSPGSPISASLDVNLNPAPTVKNLIIQDENKLDGVIQVGDTLTAVYDFVDNERDSDASIYLWTRGMDPNIVPIGNGRSYTLTDTDDLQTIGFEITPMDSTGDSGMMQSKTVIVGNTHPIAEPDNISIPEAPPNFIALTPGQIFNNDAIASNKPLNSLSFIGFDNTITIGKARMGGAYYLNGEFESLAFREPANDSFVYTVIDDGGGYDSATVTVNITGTNDRPLPEDDTIEVNETDSDVMIDVLNNDFDIDSTDELTISGTDEQTFGTFGTVRTSGDLRSVIYTPPNNLNLAPGQTAIDRFAYTVNDGRGIVPNTQRSNLLTISTNTAIVIVTIVGQ